MDTESRVPNGASWKLPFIIGIPGRPVLGGILIGLTGRAGHGKNTVADIICDLVPEAEQYALAGPVKQMALAINPIVDYDHEGYETWSAYHVYLADVVDAKGWDSAKRDPEVRRFLQRLGTEGVRGTFGDDAWINLMWKWWESSSARVGVLTDVRFPNELEAVDVSIRVVRPDAGDLTPENSQHASEQLTDVADFVVHNNGSLADLRDEVYLVLSELGLVQSPVVVYAGQ